MNQTLLRGVVYETNMHQNINENGTSLSELHPSPFIFPRAVGARITCVCTCTRQEKGIQRATKYRQWIYTYSSQVKAMIYKCDMEKYMCVYI